MAKDLANMWTELSLKKYANLDFDTLTEELHDGITRGKHCVLGKLIVDRLVSKETIRKTLLRGWKLSGSLSFQVFGGQSLFGGVCEHGG